MAELRRVRIVYADKNPIVVSVPPKVQIQAENHFDAPLSQLNGVKHAFWMAWAAATHAGEETRDYDTFLDSLIDVEAVRPDE